jgi:hypothetical protein
MINFLGRIAKKLYSENGSNLRDHCLVFPNRRAGLFFIKYLSSEITQPVWTPSIITINDLFFSFSKLQTVENEILLFELYKVYRRIVKSPESFDDFYFWGDMLINDFDDIDKYLINASVLFTNIKDIKHIDELFGGLSIEQTDIIKKFWTNFEPGNPTKEKTGFISIWAILNELYTEFRCSLKTMNFGYEGMIFRDVIENLDKINENSRSWNTIHFIGFNALNNCEKAIMTRLKKKGMARFYWDYDNSYVTSGIHNSAGFFMRKNLKNFGNDMPDDWSFDTLLSSDTAMIKRQVIEASSDVAQVKLLPAIINGLKGLTSENSHNTAVILADENLLIPVLTSIPESIGDVNITMGFPLKQTNIYSLICDLIALQKNYMLRDGVLLFSNESVINLLKNSLMTRFLQESLKELIKGILESGLSWIQATRFDFSDQLKMIFTRPSTPALLSDYFKKILSEIALNNEDNNNVSDNSLVQRNIRNEFIYRVMLSLNRLETITKSPDIHFTNDTWIRIFERLLRIQSVPFSGEPLSGIQIMGILETRALDFENLIILSVNEGVLPAVTTGSSFIPFSLREAFHLPSINHQESIYAYHFYRLLLRAKNVTFIYNSNTDGLRSGEISRFLLQMKYEQYQKPGFLDLTYEIKSHSSISEKIDRTKDHSQLLKNRFINNDNPKILSPSAINTWLSCRMKFYYRYVNGLSEPEKLSADIDPAMLGSLLHDIIKRLYQPFIGQKLMPDFIESLLSERQKLSDLIEYIFCEKFNRPANSFINGNELIVRDVLMKYLERILKADKLYAPFTILNIEDQFSFKMTANKNEKFGVILAGGKIDRVDMKDGVTRIVDYKTGIVSDNIKSIDSLFADDRKKDPDAWLQTLLYCEAYNTEKNGTCIYPSVYVIKKTPFGKIISQLKIKADRNTEIEINNYNNIRDEFMDGLSNLVSIIFSNDEPFLMTNDVWNKCSYCQFRVLCIR